MQFKETEKGQWGRIWSIFVVSGYILYLSMRKNKNITNIDRIILISISAFTYITCYYAYKDNSIKEEDIIEKKVGDDKNHTHNT